MPSKQVHHDRILSIEERRKIAASPRIRELAERVVASKPRVEDPEAWAKRIVEDFFREAK